MSHVLPYYVGDLLVIDDDRKIKQAADRKFAQLAGRAAEQDRQLEEIDAGNSDKDSDVHRDSDGRNGQPGHS